MTAYRHDKEDKGFEPLRAFTHLTVFKTVPFSRTWVILHSYKENLIKRSKWTLQDSNLRPDGYEPSALTN